MVAITSTPFSVRVLADASEAELDWLARSTAPGVVWVHDFRSQAEVDAFRWAGGTGNDPGDLGRPNTVRRNTSDGVTGACLELWRPAGSSDGATWWRPMSPLAGSGNGRGVDDPGAGGAIAAREWLATQGGSQTRRHDLGYYGHPSYHSQWPGQFDGTGYYFQVRVKMDPNRDAPGNRNGGKLFYFTRTDRSLTSQEIVTVSGKSYDGVNYFSMYRSGSPPLVDDHAGSSNQPNNEVGFCDWPRAWTCRST